MVPRTKARLLFSSALILISLSGMAAFVAISRLLQAQGWVTHTREVQVALSEVNTVLSRVGRARVQYVDSGDDAHLEDYHAGVDQVQPALDNLKRLISDNAAQVAREIELERIVDQRLNLMDQSIALKKHGESTLEGQSRITQRIVLSAGEMDETIQTMQEQEQSLLDLRTSRLRREEQFTAALLGAAFVLSIVLFILHYRLLNIELEGRHQAEVSLRKLSARILQIQDEE